MKYYNVKVIDFGNGEKQVVTFKNPVALQEEENERVRIDKSVLSEFNPIVDLNPLSPEEIERKALHSFFSSSNRTKREIYKIARSNTWEYFITFTFDSKKVDDRTDYDALLKKVTKYFNHWRERKAPELRYLLIPEQHKKIEDNGLRAWHFHGLIAGTDGLTFIPLSDAEKKYYDIDCSDEVYRIKEYKLGFCTATKVQSNDRVSSYITKYITKSMCAVSKNKKRYVCSRNLNRPLEHLYFCHTYQEQFEDKYKDWSLDDLVHFDDLVDISKVVHKSKKEVAAEGYDNVITYYELRDADIPIMRDVTTAPPAGTDGRTFDRPLFPDKLIKRKGD